MTEFIKVVINDKLIYNGDTNGFHLVMTGYKYLPDGTKVERVFDSKKD